MNRNVNSRFAYSPTVNIGRSKFDMPHDHKTSWNVGDLIPTLCLEVLPGDTVQLDTNILARMQTLVAPIMDNLYLDTYYFFVPDRLVWSHFKNFMGENGDSAWIPQETYSIPITKSPANGWEVGTIADYLGIPTGVGNIEVSSLPFRAYALICQEWFRSEVVTDPLNIPVGEADTQGTNGDNYIDDVVAGGKPFKAAKFFDVFTAGTPSPSKGPEITIDIAPGSTVPVTGNGIGLGITNGNELKTLGVNYEQVRGAGIGSTNGTSVTGNTGWNSNVIGVPTLKQLGDNPEYSGLVANLTGAGVITINELRQAFQIQKFYEKGSLYGTRYREVLRSQFGTSSPDSRMMIPEYLGGHRIPVNVSQVLQTSASGTGDTPQGNTAAYSLTADHHSDFTQSFTEHGYIIGVAVARYDHTYQQGIPKTFLRRSIFDFYWPVFSSLGNQKITNAEIYAQGKNVINPDTGKPYDDEVFCYQEAWYDYRHMPNRISGMLRSQYEESLDVWHLGDYYESLPHLSDEWIREDKNNVDRALAVTSQLSNQMFGDFWFDLKMTRAMPLYSIPGLIDHH